MAPLGLMLRAAAPSARAPVTEIPLAPLTLAPPPPDGAAMDRMVGTPLDLIIAVLAPSAYAAPYILGTLPVLIMNPVSCIVVSIGIPAVGWFSAPAIAILDRNLAGHQEGVAAGAGSPLLSGCQRTSTPSICSHTRAIPPRRGLGPCHPSSP